MFYVAMGVKEADLVKLKCILKPLDTTSSNIGTKVQLHSSISERWNFTGEIQSLMAKSPILGMISYPYF